MVNMVTRILFLEAIQETDSVFTGWTAKIRVAHKAAVPVIHQELEKMKKNETANNV